MTDSEANAGCFLGVIMLIVFGIIGGLLGFADGGTAQTAAGGVALGMIVAIVAFVVMVSNK